MTIEAFCPFCSPAPLSVFFESPLVVGLWDAYPVSPGHALLAVRRHVPTWFEATSDERIALIEAIDRAKAAVEQEHKPDGWNIGINVGSAAGQTIPHLHAHLIPRYQGDVADPRGGVRHVIPSKAHYLNDGSAQLGALPHTRALIRGETADPLIEHLIAHLDKARSVDIAVAFTLKSGVEKVYDYLSDVLDRGSGARIRIITGDYLGVTEPDALVQLLDLPEGAEIRVFESAGLSFHPKAYIIHQSNGHGVALVGSSNLSKNALSTGVEWNYRVITDRDRAGFQDVVDAFESLWAHPQTRPLNRSWVDTYRRRRQPPVPAQTGEPIEPLPPPPEPHAIQREALAALSETRARGHTAGLVVLATGLGKTWLSAFDTVALGVNRVLFVAHREEILDQALQTYRRIRPQALLGKYTGSERLPDADVLFASIQTLGRQTHLDRFVRDAFDYIVVDEFHHAAARTYRRLLDHFTPRFLLGLTATPERTDGGDLLSLCGENLVYESTLIEGITQGLLCPFRYFGVPDDVDYANIPWRSNRFDEEALTTAVATERRAHNAYEQFLKHRGTSAIGFCVSQRHADFMANWFRRHGVTAVAVHAGPTSAPRAHALEELAAGRLDILFAVDIFNEGVDLPQVDTILMLRPTESRILWLQQFGRGLRRRPGKTLTVVDYIGNHRSFLLKPRALLDLGPEDGILRAALRSLADGTFPLPPGCSVTYELEARDIIESLLRAPRRQEVLESYYEAFMEATGTRPTASEALHDGYDPRAVRQGYGSWLGFVRSKGGLTTPEERVWIEHRDFFEALEETEMTRSYKMLVLLAMLSRGQMPGQITISELAEAVLEAGSRFGSLHPEMADLGQDPAELRDHLERNPISAWVGGRGTRGIPFFTYSAETFRTAFDIAPADREAFEGLVREIVEWRLVQYIGSAPESLPDPSSAGSVMPVAIPSSSFPIGNACRPCPVAGSP